MNRTTIVLRLLGFLFLGLGFGMGWARTWTSAPALVGTVVLTSGTVPLLAAALVQWKAAERSIGED